MSELRKNGAPNGRDSSGRFVVGNAGGTGRPRVNLTWKERCRQFMEDDGGWAELVKIARGEVDFESALGGLKLICEYAYGKPQQHVDVTSGGVPLIKALTSDDLALLELPEPK